MRTALTISAVSAAVVGLVAAAPAALADPQPAGFRTYAAVGSDTTQDVWNGLTNGYGTTAAVLPKVASYDAFPLDSFIQTKSGGPTFARPNGSGDGVKALTASLTNGLWKGVNIGGQVDIARSSSGPVAGSGLTYVPFARDAVSVAVRTGGTVKLTRQQLINIYTCQTSTIQVGTKTVTVHPKLPQAASGTRKFFLTVLGVTPGACVQQLDMPENDGRVIPNAGDMIPFSAAQYIAQKNGAVTDTTTGTSLAWIDGLSAAKRNATTGQWLPGTLYGSVTAPVSGGFARDTYNVIGTAKLGTALETTVDKAAASGAALSRYGFKKLGYAGNNAYYLSGAYQY